jgi:hypothetical protein
MRATALEQPDDKRPENVAEKMKEEAEERARVAEDTPGAGVGRGDRGGWWDGFHVPTLSHVRSARQAHLVFRRGVRNRDRCDTRAALP